MMKDVLLGVGHLCTQKLPLGSNNAGWEESWTLKFGTREVPNSRGSCLNSKLGFDREFHVGKGTLLCPEGDIKLVNKNNSQVFTLSAKGKVEKQVFFKVVFEFFKK